MKIFRGDKRRLNSIFKNDDRRAQTRAFLSFYVSDMAGRVPAACKGEKCMLCSEHAMLSKADGASANDRKEAHGCGNADTREGWK